MLKSKDLPKIDRLYVPPNKFYRIGQTLNKFKDSHPAAGAFKIKSFRIMPKSNTCLMVGRHEHCKTDTTRIAAFMQNYYVYCDGYEFMCNSQTIFPTSAKWSKPTDKPQKAEEEKTHSETLQHKSRT